MRIFIIDEAIDKVGGVERIINTLANNLCKKYDVNVVSIYKTTDKEFYKYNDKVKIEYINNIKESLCIVEKSDSLLKKIIIKCKRLVSIFNTKKKLSEFSKKITKDDVIIIGRVRIAWKYVELFKNAKKIIVRDAIHLINCKNYEKLIMKKKFPTYVDTFIVSSDESKRIYEKFFNNNLNMVKLYNPLGIDYKNVFNIANKKIIAIGRNDSQKAYEVLIKAFSLVSNKNNEWKLEIVGGQNDNNLKKIVQDLDIEDNVIFSPICKNVVEKLSTAGIFVMTSRYEGYANSLVEASSCGIPVISVNWLCGVDEIIKNKENGIIVELEDRYKYYNGKSSPKDIINLFKAMNLLIKDDNLRYKMSENSNMISDLRNEKVIIEKWINIIER